MPRFSEIDLHREGNITRSVAVVFIILAAFSSQGFAECNPWPPSPAPRHFQEVDAVFRGTAQSAVESPNDESRTRFILGQSWKGVDESEVTVLSEGGEAYPFTRGGEYLVYASRDSAGNLWTSICTRTGPATERAGDLAYLATVLPIALRVPDVNDRIWVFAAAGLGFLFLAALAAMRISRGWRTAA
jgi:hypothetical protein